MVRRVVIDSNGLQSDALCAFLAAGSNHVAVLHGYDWMEAYDGGRGGSRPAPVVQIRHRGCPLLAEPAQAHL
jgi:hypothetical protein